MKEPESFEDWFLLILGLKEHMHPLWLLGQSLKTISILALDGIGDYFVNSKVVVRLILLGPSLGGFWGYRRVDIVGTWGGTRSKKPSWFVRALYDLPRYIEGTYI